MIPSSEASEFDLEEFKALREEILQKVDAISKLEVVCVGGAAAVYAWLGTRAVPTPTELWFIPVLFPLLGGIRAYYLGRQTVMAGDYIRTLEKRLRPAPLTIRQPRAGTHVVHGWEEYIRLPFIQARFIDRVSRIFWNMFLLLTLVLPFIFVQDQPLPANQQPLSRPSPPAVTPR